MPRTAPEAATHRPGIAVRMFPLLVFLLSMGMTLAVFQYERHQNDLERQALAARDATLITAELRAALNRPALQLHAIQAFHAASDTVSAAEWQGFVHRLQAAGPATAAIAYGFAARRPAPQDDGTTTALPVVHARPGNALPAIDLYALPEVAEAIDRARDHGSIALSRRLALGSLLDGSEGDGLLMALPVYDRRSPAATLAERRRALAGVVFAVLRVDRLMDGLQRASGSTLALRIFDDESFNSTRENGPPALLYGAGTAGEPVDRREMEFGLRNWSLEFVATDVGPLRQETIALLVAGLIISLLLGLASRTQTSHRERAERLARDMTRELRLSEERFQLAAAGTNDGLWDSDLIGGTFWHSDRLKAMLGYPQDVDTSRPDFLLAHVHPDDRPALDAALAAHFREGQPYHVEFRFQKGDGEWAWFRARAQGVRDGNGRAARLVGSVADITEQKRAERERAAADRQRKAILDAATEVSIILTDRDGIIRLFNRGAEKMLGYTAEELVGQSTPERLHLGEEVAARGRFLTAELGHPVSGFEVFVTLARTHGAERREWTYVRKDGSCLTVSLVVTAVRDEDGSIAGYLGIATDVSERKQALAALEQQRARMETIIEHIPGGVSLIDAGLHFIAANQKLKEVLDLPDALFAGGPPSLYEVALFNARRGEYGPGDPEGLACAIVEQAHQTVPHEFERTRPDGRTIEVRGTPLPDGGFVTIYTDVTERKQAEAELLRHRDHLREMVEERTADLMRAKEAAERANEAKSDFLANMSHELRTPLHSVLSFASRGGERARAAQQDKLCHYFERIHQSGSRLLAHVNDLLDLAKLEAGKMSIEPSVQDVLPIIREALAEFEAVAAERQVSLTIAQPAADTRAAVDADRLVQVVGNLLSNAIKFSPVGGRVVVELADARLARGRRATDAGDIGALQITVRDDGPGIPEGELEAVFEKFVQSSWTNTGAGGTGLGLSICREIVHAHRGSIRACNNPQGGAAFSVTLPRELQAPQ